MWSYVRSGPGNQCALFSETSRKRRLFHQAEFIFKKALFCGSDGRGCAGISDAGLNGIPTGAPPER
jgi:hypothetical protein